MNDNSKVSVVIADDHTLLREALREILLGGGFHVVGEARDGESAVSLAARLRPDIVLLDIEMPCSHGPLTVQRLREVSQDSRVIVLSMHDEQELVSEVLRSGARAYLHKGVSKQELIWTLHNAMTDSQFVTVSVSRESMTRPPESERPGALSTREAEVLGYVAAAMSNRQIARHLGITEGTVKRHLSNVFDKLAAVSRIDAVNKAIADGLIQARPRHHDAAGEPSPGVRPRTTRQPTLPSHPTAVTRPTPGREPPDPQRARRPAS
jgi:two-component system, NarL family, nitrate/nitrite response regulator NarL